MSRGTKSRSALAACLVALVAVLVPPQAIAAPAATEQYVLTLPGVERGRQVSVVADAELEPAPDAGAGVTGERRAAASPVSAVITVASSPSAVLVIAVITVVAAIATRRTREPR